jgi:hypothetical protein
VEVRVKSAEVYIKKGEEKNERSYTLHSRIRIRASETLVVSREVWCYVLASRLHFV